MISVNQGIGTSVPENWILFLIEGGDLWMLGLGGGGVEIFKGEGWNHGGHHVEGERGKTNEHVTIKTTLAISVNLV